MNFNFFYIFHLICKIVKKHLSAINPKQRQIEGICSSTHFINEIICPLNTPISKGLQIITDHKITMCEMPKDTEFWNRKNHLCEKILISLLVPVHVQLWRQNRTRNTLERVVHWKSQIHTYPPPFIHTVHMLAHR